VETSLTDGETPGRSDDDEWRVCIVFAPALTTTLQRRRGQRICFTGPGQAVHQGGEMKAMNLPTPQVLAPPGVAINHLSRLLYHAPIRFTSLGLLFDNRPPLHAARARLLPAAGV
jgi:hypothetical protein